MTFSVASSNDGSSVFLTVPTSATNSSFRAISDGLAAQTIYSILVCKNYVTVSNTVLITYRMAELL